jgi:magnesium-transporting ATPase (P-type)
VIALGATQLDRTIESFEQLPEKARLDFIGFVAVADILRPEAKKAVKAADLIKGFETYKHLSQFRVI